MNLSHCFHLVHITYWLLGCTKIFLGGRGLSGGCAYIAGSFDRGVLVVEGNFPWRENWISRHYLKKHQKKKTVFPTESKEQH